MPYFGGNTDSVISSWRNNATSVMNQSSNLGTIDLSGMNISAKVNVYPSELFRSVSTQATQSVVQQQNAVYEAIISDLNDYNSYQQSGPGMAYNVLESRRQRANSSQQLGIVPLTRR